MKGTTDNGEVTEELKGELNENVDRTEGETTVDTSAEPAEELSELAQAIRERDEAKDLWMRAQADYQNLRRRAQADIDGAVLRAKTEVLGEAVTVLDYLDMALAMEVTTEEAKNLKVGVEMTRGQLQGLFDRLNVKPVLAEGTFDASVHQALSTVETTDHEPGTIMEVVRGGWMMGESVLRYAQVRVAAEPEAPKEVEAEVTETQPTPEPDTEA